MGGLASVHIRAATLPIREIRCFLLQAGVMG